MSKPPALRRIQADIRELAMDRSDQYYAAPLEDDMFEWHFTIRGAPDTDFEGGVYHGRILLPKDYPFKPPNIVFLTPSGRFETGVKVCLSFSAHHPELWQPAWGIRLILEALISFLPTPADGAIGALDWSSAERKKMAKKSQEYCCPSCGPVKDLIPEIGSVKGSRKKSRFQDEIQKLHELQAWMAKKDAEKKAKSAEEETTKDQEETQKAPPVADEGNVEIEQKDSLCEETQQTPPPQPQVPESEPTSTPTVNETPASTPSPTMPSHQTPTQSTSTVTPATNTRQEQSIPFLSDPLVHGIMVCMVAIIAILFLKIQVLLAELKALDESALN